MHLKALFFSPSSGLTTPGLEQSKGLVESAKTRAKNDFLTVGPKLVSFLK